MNLPISHMTFALANIFVHLTIPMPNQITAGKTKSRCDKLSNS